MDYSSGRHCSCRIFEYKHRGLTFLDLENSLIKISIIVDKGADIYKLVYKPLDLDFLFKTPNEIRETGKFVATVNGSGGSYCDHFFGGWQEILPGGGPDTYKGAEIGLHGELTTLPWEFKVIEDDPKRISVELTCKTVRFPFCVKKAITINQNSSVIYFQESLINEAHEDLEFIWAQHPAFGEPFIDSSCRIDVPATHFETSDFYNSCTAVFEAEHKGTWPIDTDKNGNKVDLTIVPSGETPISDLYYLRGIDEGWYAITNTNKKIGFGMCWDKEIFPYVNYWQVCNGSFGYPWYGRTYNIGMEIWNSFTDKIRTAKANGTIKTIKAKEEIKTSYLAVIYTGIERVKRITKSGEVY